jgi:hypothetical protein
MKTRDRVISAIVVGGIIALIWVGGSKLRGDHASDAEAPSASTSASASPVTSTSASTSPVTSASASAGPVDAAPPISGACKAMADATTRKLDDAKKARACTPAFDTSELQCHTSSNGATWGLRVDDVVDLGEEPCKTGWLVRLVHLDVNGNESAVVPGISHALRAHTYNASLELHLADISFFDYDGDGDDEVFLRGTRGNGDRADDERGQVWTFATSDAGTRIAPYPPSASFTILGTQDIDSDGRPDLMISFVGAGKDAPPTSRRFAAHSLKDGTFSIRDTAAVTWAEKQCPSDPTLDLSQFDAGTADAMVCALVWGRDLSKACRGLESGACPPWAEKLSKTKAPLSLR